MLLASDIVFLEKFAFTFSPGGERSGRFNLTVHLNGRASHSARLLIFDDEEASYPAPDRTWSSLSCDERLERAKHGMLLQWDLASSAEGQTVVHAIRQKLRPRWWYIAVADCALEASQATEALQVSWKLRLTNPPYGWAEEFSVDRRFAPHVSMLLALASGCLLGMQLVAWSHLARSAQAIEDSASGKGAHRFTQLLLFGLTLAFAEAVLSLAHHLCFSFDGVGAPALGLAGQLAALGSSFVLASLLLLISEGKCISYMLVTSDMWRMLRKLGPFLTSCMLLELWSEYSLSHAYSTDYVYTTPGGSVLVGFDLVLLALYASSWRRTLAQVGTQEDGRFYRTWGLVYMLWFLALPVSSLLARTVLAPYACFVVSLAVKKGTTVLVYASLVMGFWPGRRADAAFRTHRDVLRTCSEDGSSGKAQALSRPLSPRLPGLLFNGRWQFEGPASRQRSKLSHSCSQPQLSKLAMSP